MLWSDRRTNGNGRDHFGFFLCWKRKKEKEERQGGNKLRKALYRYSKLIKFTLIIISTAHYFLLCDEKRPYLMIQAGA